MRSFDTCKWKKPDLDGPTPEGARYCSLSSMTQVSVCRNALNSRPEMFDWKPRPWLREWESRYALAGKACGLCGQTKFCYIGRWCGYEGY